MSTFNHKRMNFQLVHTYRPDLLNTKNGIKFYDRKRSQKYKRQIYLEIFFFKLKTFGRKLQK